MGGGKGGGGGGSSSYNFFGTIAGLLCLGPVDEIYGIEVDDELKWSGALSRLTSPNPVDISVPDYGRIRFYWGRDDQLSTDPLLFAENNTLGHQHPAYTGVCYAIIVDFLFGQEKTTAPTIRMFCRRAPRQAIVTGAAALLTDGQANVIAVIAELLTDPRIGLGWTADMLDIPSFQAAADIAQAHNALTSVSPVLTKAGAAKATVVDMLAMVDGWMRQNRLTGRLEIGVWTPPEDINIDALPIINEAALTARPRLKPDTWDDIVTRWRCTYNDREKNFKERGVKYDVTRARRARGRKKPETLRLNFITRHAQALSYMRERAHRRGSPGVDDGTLSVRASLFPNLQVGQHVRVDIDPEPGGMQRLQVYRVKEIIHREGGDELQLKIDSERTLATAPVFPPDDPFGPPAPPAPVPDIIYARFFALPPSLADGKGNRVGILASRPDGMVTGYRVYYDDNPADLFPLIGGTRSFALRGRLHAALGDGDNNNTVSVEILDAFGDEIISENPGVAAARDDALLMIILKPGVAAGTQGAGASAASAGAGVNDGVSDGGGVTTFAITPPVPPTGGPLLPPSPSQIVDDGGGVPWLEVCSCVELVASAPGVLAVTVLRARQGTALREFAVGDEVWFIRRGQLAVIEHADFDKLAVTLSTGYFKLQPYEAGRMRPLEDCAPRGFTFGLTAYIIQEGTLGNLVLDPPVANFGLTMEVRISAAGWQEVHYTLDGAAVTVDSPSWPVEPLWGIDQDAPRQPLAIDRSCHLRVRGWERKAVSRATGRFTGRSTPEVEGYYISTAAVTPAVAITCTQYMGELAWYFGFGMICYLVCWDIEATIHYRIMGQLPAGSHWFLNTDNGSITLTSNGNTLVTGWYTISAKYVGEEFSTDARGWYRVQAYATRQGYRDSLVSDGFYDDTGSNEPLPTWPS